MDYELKKRRLDINKKLKVTILVALLSWLGTWAIAFSSVDNVFLILEVMLTMLQVNELPRELLLMGCRLLISWLPTIVYLIGGYKVSELIKESKKLQEEETSYMRKKQFEEQKPQVQEILAEVEKLSRSEQMEYLNMVKDKLNELEKAKKINLKSTDDFRLCYLERELEDMLFPSTVDDSESYSRTRKK